MTDRIDTKKPPLSAKRDTIEQFIRNGLTAVADGYAFMAQKRLAGNSVIKTVKLALILTGMLVVDHLLSGFINIVYSEEQIQQLNPSEHDIEVFNLTMAMTFTAILVFIGFLYRIAAWNVRRFTESLYAGTMRRSASPTDIAAFPVAIGLFLVTLGMISPYVTSMGIGGIITVIGAALLDGAILISEDIAIENLHTARLIRERAEKFVLTDTGLNEVIRYSTYTEYINGQAVTILVDTETANVQKTNSKEEHS